MAFNSQDIIALMKLIQSRYYIKYGDKHGSQKLFADTTGVDHLLRAKLLKKEIRALWHMAIIGIIGTLIGTILGALLTVYIKRP